MLALLLRITRSRDHARGRQGRSPARVGPEANRTDTGSGDNSGWELTPLGKILLIAAGPALVLVAVHLWLGPSHPTTHVAAPTARSLPTTAPVAPAVHRNEANRPALAPTIEAPVALNPTGPTPQHPPTAQARKVVLATTPAVRSKHPTATAARPPVKPKSPAATATPAPTPPTTTPQPAPSQTRPLATPTNTTAPKRATTRRQAIAPKPHGQLGPTNVRRAQQPRRLRHRPMPPTRAPQPTATPGSPPPPQAAPPRAATNPTPPTASTTGSGYTNTQPGPRQAPSKPDTDTKRVRKR